MPSSKPRVNLTLEPVAFETLTRLSKAAKLPRARLLADLLDEALPLMERSAVMLEQAATLSAEARQQLRHKVDGLDAQATAGALQVFDAITKAETAIRKARKAAPRSTRSVPAGGRRPPRTPAQ